LSPQLSQYDKRSFQLSAVIFVVIISHLFVISIRSNNSLSRSTKWSNAKWLWCGWRQYHCVMYAVCRHLLLLHH